MQMAAWARRQASAHAGIGRGGLRMRHPACPPNDRASSARMQHAMQLACRRMHAPWPPDARRAKPDAPAAEPPAPATATAAGTGDGGGEAKRSKWTDPVPAAAPAAASGGGMSVAEKMAAAASSITAAVNAQQKMAAVAAQGLFYDGIGLGLAGQLASIPGVATISALSAAVAAMPQGLPVMGGGVGVPGDPGGLLAVPPPGDPPPGAGDTFTPHKLRETVCGLLLLLHASSSPPSHAQIPVAHAHQPRRSLADTHTHASRSGGAPPAHTPSLL
jgi:hypothetical protein